MIILKEKIIDYMKEKKLSIAALEKQAGLSVHSIRNILKDRIKNPSAQSLQIIAETLECSLDDLIQKSLSRNGEAEQAIKLIIKSKNGVILDDIKLMGECSQTILALMRDGHEVLFVDDYFNIVKNVYYYSAREKNRKVNHKFSKWFIDYVSRQ